MNKQDFMKLQSCVLRVNIDCDGCKSKVKKLLQKIDGVYTTAIDVEQGKVIVTGNVDPAILIRKLEKSGKRAELWGPPQKNNHQNLINNNNNKSHKVGNNNQPKSVKVGGGGQQQQQQQQLLMQQLKGSKDMLMPHKEKKSVKFNLPEDDSDDFDDGDGDFDDEEDGEFDYDDFDDDGHHLPKPNKGMMINEPDMNIKKGGGGGGKKGGGIDITTLMMGRNGGKKGVSKEDVNKGGKKDKRSGKRSGGFFGFGKKKGGESKNSEISSGGGLLGFGKKSKDEEVSTHKNGSGAGGNNNGPKKGGPKKDGAHDMGKIKNEFDIDSGNHGKAGHGGGGKNMGPMGPMGQMGQMGNYTMGPPMANHPMGPVGVPAVPGMPASAAGGYYQGMGPGNNPYENQQYMAMMMNQQARMNGGNDMYQPMMYARPPPAVNYGAPPMAPHASDHYTHYFSDENANNCSVM
ncbi:hypothetical protein Q3G72_000082 [Acer saccharum]|nr:hypothetical protein Q3G72_000082 [Acer saccharum]